MGGDTQHRRRPHDPRPRLNSGLSGCGHHARQFSGEVTIHNHEDADRNLTRIDWEPRRVDRAALGTTGLVVADVKARLQEAETAPPGQVSGNPMALIADPVVGAGKERTFFFWLSTGSIPENVALRFDAISLTFTFDNGLTLSLPSDINMGGAGC